MRLSSSSQTDWDICSNIPIILSTLQDWGSFGAWPLGHSTIWCSTIWPFDTRSFSARPFNHPSRIKPSLLVARPGLSLLFWSVVTNYTIISSPWLHWSLTSRDRGGLLYYTLPDFAGISSREIEGVFLLSPQLLRWIGRCVLVFWYFCYPLNSVGSWSSPRTSWDLCSDVLVFLLFSNSTGSRSSFQMDRDLRYDILIFLLSL